MNVSSPSDGIFQEPTIDPARQQKAKEYARNRRYVEAAEILLSGILLFILIFSGLSAELSGRIRLSSVFGAGLYFVILSVAYRIVTIPFDYYQGFVLPRRYGLLTQKLTSWLADEIKGGLLSLVLGAGMVLLLYWFITSYSSLWWLLSWGMIVSLSLTLTGLAPVVIVPLFFKMKPLPDTDLKQRLEELAKRANFNIGGIYLIELSSRGNIANAGLMGTGKTKRIVLSDTLLQRYSEPEIEIVTAHELGHHLNRDTIRLLVIHSAIWLVVFFAVGLVLPAATTLFGFRGLMDIAAFPLLVLTVALFALLVMPVINGYRRKIEADADDYALRLTNNPEIFASAMAKLTDQNLSEAQPNPWIERLTYDHPSYHRRMEHARAYATAIKGKE
ncbi:MAG: M48 family metallopeptidase [Chloroflexi bacterium]|nr:M48 family metallopeptidase [Chloroflexota bacterium]